MTAPSSLVCARCPRVLGVSCCEVTPEERLATLTLADVERVREHTGLAAAAFCDEEWWEAEEARRYEERRPLYRGYFRHGARRLTLRRTEGACVFHDPASGCGLPAEVRPTACRLFPFELWPDGTWTLQVERHGSLAAARAFGAGCLAVEQAEDMDGVLGAFGTSRAEVEAVGRTLRHEVEDHARRTAPGAMLGGRSRRRRGR